MSSYAVCRLSAQKVSHAIVTAAMRVHSELGPGLLESAYQACLQFELREAGVRSEAQVGLPVVYRGRKLDLGYRIDLLVENLVIVGRKDTSFNHKVDKVLPRRTCLRISFVVLR